jgi:AICAR transformylase/IMP cyclohydrolase PurH
MKKISKIVTLSLMSITILGISIPTQAASIDINSIAITSNADDIVSVKAVLKRAKTVRKTYKKASQVPEYITYSEYDSTLDVDFTGTLELQSVKKVGSEYKATFTGTLFASGL